MTQSEIKFKVLVIGEPRVGKTAFVARYCTREWLPNYKVTIGADYAVKTIKWSESETVRLHIWDIAGQDYAKTMARTYYRGASGCIIMFDVTNKRSFEEAKGWKADVDRRVFLPSSENVPCILLANKDDLPNKAVTQQEVDKFVKDNGFLTCIYISVKENRNLAEAVCQLVETMLQQEGVKTDQLWEMSETSESNTGSVPSKGEGGGGGGGGGGGAGGGGGGGGGKGKGKKGGKGGDGADGVIKLRPRISGSHSGEDEGSGSGGGGGGGCCPYGSKQN